MSNAVDISLILREAWASGAQLKVRDGKVVVTGPTSVLSMQLLGRIRDNKAAIIARLNEIERVMRESSVPTGPGSGGAA